MKTLRLEFYKMRRKRIFLTIALLLSVEIAWAFMATGMSIAKNPDHAGWEPLIATLSSMNGLFMPLLTAVCVSRICDMEHKGNTWKLLLSLSVRRSRLYWAKFAAANGVLLAVCMLQTAAIAAFGAAHDFEGVVSVKLLVWFLAGSTLTNMAVSALQLWVSMTVINQAFSLSLGMIGGFIGMTAGLFPSGIRHLFIWSSYTSLSPVLQSYSSDTVVFSMQNVGSWLASAGLLAAVGAVLFAAGCLHVSRQEV